MIVCISSEGRELSSRQDPRFGRCEAFYLFDTEKNEGRFIDNPWKSAVGGAGVRAAELLVKEGAVHLVTGHIGPNAWDVLNAAGIQVHEAKEDTVAAALEAFLHEKLETFDGPDSQGHHKAGIQ